MAWDPYPSNSRASLYTHTLPDDHVPSIMMRPSRHLPTRHAAFGDDLARSYNECGYCTVEVYSKIFQSKGGQKVQICSHSARCSRSGLRGHTCPMHDFMHEAASAGKFHRLDCVMLVLMKLCRRRLLHPSVHLGFYLISFDQASAVQCLHAWDSAH